MPGGRAQVWLSVRQAHSRGSRRIVVDPDVMLRGNFSPTVLPTQVRGPFLSSPWLQGRSNLLLPPHPLPSHSPEVMEEVQRAGGGQNTQILKWHAAEVFARVVPMECVFGDVVGALKARESVDAVFHFSYVALGLLLLAGPRFSSPKNGDNDLPWCADKGSPTRSPKKKGGSSLSFGVCTTICRRLPPPRPIWADLTERGSGKTWTQVAFASPELLSPTHHRLLGQAK